MPPSVLKGTRRHLRSVRSLEFFLVLPKTTLFPFIYGLCGIKSTPQNGVFVKMEPTHFRGYSQPYSHPVRSTGYVHIWEFAKAGLSSPCTPSATCFGRTSTAPPVPTVESSADPLPAPHDSWHREQGWVGGDWKAFCAPIRGLGASLPIGWLQDLGGRQRGMTLRLLSLSRVCASPALKSRHWRARALGLSH